jgi:LmbE family N-acetylglucosaminyl deacetylase
MILSFPDPGERRRGDMRAPITAATVAFFLLLAPTTTAQAPRTLVAVWAHADDEGPVGPILARYAREGVQVYLIIATDGAQGVGNTSVPRGPEVAKLRAEEARCSAQALGVQPPILLGFPDAGLGNYLADPALLFRLTQRLQEELQRLRPDVLITWGPDGGTGHPDHRIVSSIVTQLVRAGAPSVPQRVFYASIPADGFRVMNPGRGAPPYLVPQASLFTAHISFAPTDLESARRSMSCHKTQYPQEAVERVITAMGEAWKGELPLTPMVPQAGVKDLFQ